MQNKGLNILYVGGFELPDKNAAAQRVIANGKLLRSLGHEVKYLGANKEDHYANLEESYKKHYDFDTWSIPYPKTFTKWIDYVTKLTISSILLNSQNIKPDIIIIYNFPALASSKLIRYCKKNNIKLIGDITEWYGHKVRSLLGLIKYIDSELRMRYYNKKFEGLICISKYLYEYYKNSVKNTIQIPPLVDLTDEKWKVDILPKKDKKVIVYAGSPGGKDKINKLIDSFLKTDNISEMLEFRVIGIAEKDFLKRYSYFTNDQKEIIKTFTIFLGRIPHKEVIKEVTNADFSAFLREDNKTNNAGFPTKFVESISCGTPVLTNKTSNIEDFLIEGENGYWIDIAKLTYIIEIPKDHIVFMKQNCANTKEFDYNKYQNLIKKIL
jgi:glycosyltransferase involved in cell wall biosynthesis